MLQSGACTGAHCVVVAAVQPKRLPGRLPRRRLGLELEAAERRLQEASKGRESRLRKAGIAGRLQMALELRRLDAQARVVSALCFAC
jgi:hypothetical protein